MAISKLSVKGCAFAAGVMWGAAILFLGVLATRGHGLPLMRAFASLYPGYQPTFFGVLIGTVWGLIDGCIAGALFAWVYNHFVKA